ncbi:2-polyprenyl-6-methoxyphenol hydroxylase-like FAD-dependent oxidoreductase [Actinopolyspora biskrensis]|uniref:2-polyprenyl-6-methoxyphenol hydroxylase-like FAD-dependent oxidoreductase n=1 Tax=Actinopolyspora biskrensis TaxID=1470178 RepID=A0A852YPT1_9ACTN|nr:FAD-dependent monooxygenase [Actinopolyspora biskrensis]NYH77284.1 2-polyprenyl-6-methoxyphenol hydroxylase-like FAD-dependent oxidoreductase [Actinopolyspora biskrensis]
MDDETREVDVLIVGGGPVGMALALDLRYRGVDCLLVESGDGTVSHPKVSTVGARSMELFRRWGLAEAIRNAGWPGDHPLDAAWVTAVGEHELHRLKRGTVDDRPAHEHVPEPEAVCPQHWMAPLLTGALGEVPAGPLWLRCSLEAFAQDEHGVSATVFDHGTERQHAIRARYLAGCDGASSPVRTRCGIDSPAFHPTRTFRNILFRAPELRTRLGDSNALFYFLMLSSSLRFPMRAIDGSELYRLTVGLDGDHEADEPAQELVDRAVAVETPIEVLSDNRWHLTHRVAESFRAGRVFLVGDAAHTLSPSGGFGMNTGICSAADLGWKLAAVLSGWGGEHLLDTYELERRPVAVESLEEANLNLTRTVNRSIPAELRADTPAGRRAREQMVRRLRASDVGREFNAPHIHLGFRYFSPAVATDPLDPTGAAPVTAPRATTGSRAPHCWLPDDSSTLDLFGREFVLLHVADTADLDEVHQAFADRGIPLRSVHCAQRDVAEAYELSYVLVRPDGHVAWRGEHSPEEPHRLAEAVRGAEPARHIDETAAGAR